MTPAQIYARKRRDAEILIRRSAPASSHAELIALLRPAIALNATRADDAQISTGASKFGGAPDVPAEFEWPMWQGKSLTFLAQINLAEVAALDINSQLPPSGVLLFWKALDEENPIWGEPQQRDGWRVIWANQQLFRRTPPADSRWIVEQNIHSVRLEASWIVDQDKMNWLDLDWDNWDEKHWSHFGWDVLEKPPHRLLSCAYAPQLSPLTIAANGIQGKSGFDLYDESVPTGDWRLLLQLDTGASEFFKDIHDVGWIYFMIRREDLANTDFSRVWFNQQGT